MEDPMTRFIRTFVAMLLGGSLLMAQLPNPLNLPDPLGLSRKPEPSRPAPREGRRAERQPRREKHHDQGKHKGQQKRQTRARGEHPGHDKR
jgi:hypothetical protein